MCVGSAYTIRFSIRCSFNDIYPMIFLIFVSFLINNYFLIIPFIDPNNLFTYTFTKIQIDPVFNWYYV